MLFHVSEDPGITRFEPRPSAFTPDPVVWAIDDDHLRNYLAPRDCPRVTFCAGPDTTLDDRETFLGHCHAVMAIEAQWLDRLRDARLCRYAFDTDAFECLDASAGYFVSRVAVMPRRVAPIDEPLEELARRNVELRVLPNLWALRDAVAASSLEFSIIRMRNALPRPPASA